MQGYQHLFLGITTGACMASIIPKEQAAVCVIACTIGSIFPDIDISTSKLGKRIKPASMIISHVFGHRGFIHTPLNGIILTILLCLVANEEFPCIPSAFCVGFFLHLLQDTFTKAGIMWLFPIKAKIHFTNIKSNSLLCIPITLALAAISAWILLWLVPASQTPMFI